MVKTAKIATTANFTKTFWIAKVARITELFEIVEFTENSEVVEIVDFPKTAKIAQTAEVAKVAELAEIPKNAEIAKFAEIAEIARNAKGPDTEIVGGLAKLSENEFFWKNRWILRQKTWKIFRNAKSGKFAAECVSNDINSWKCSPLYLSIFLAKCQKILNLGNLRNYDEESVFLREKKNFIMFLKTFFPKNGTVKVRQL